MAKRSWLTSASAALTGVPNTEFFGVSNTEKRERGIRNKEHLRSWASEITNVTHTLAMNREGSFDSAPGVCVWREVSQEGREVEPAHSQRGGEVHGGP